MKKLVALLAIIAAMLAVTASGAFTSITAERDATISVSGDGEALLVLAPTATVNGAYFVDSDGDGAYELRISDAQNGLNVDAIIVFEDIFTITNNGTRGVTVTLQDIGAHEDKTDFGDLESGIVLAPGQSTTVSLSIDTYGLSMNDSLIDTIKITAQ